MKKRFTQIINSQDVELTNLIDPNIVIWAEFNGTTLYWKGREYKSNKEFVDIPFYSGSSNGGNGSLKLNLRSSDREYNYNSISGVITVDLTHNHISDWDTAILEVFPKGYEGQYLQIGKGGKIQWSNANELRFPTGGEIGQFLQKKGEQSVGWTNIDNIGGSLPLDGNPGQYLKKTIEGPQWSDANEFVKYLTGGKPGQILQKTEDLYAWSDCDNFIKTPINGKAGQILQKTKDSYIWSDGNDFIRMPKLGYSGQVLQKTDTGVRWSYVEKPAFEIPSNGNSGQYLQKTDNGIEWSNAQEFIKFPPNGHTGQYLRFISSDTVEWNSGEEFIRYPEFNSEDSHFDDGKYLQKTEDGVRWSSGDEFIRLPENGKTGQYLKKADDKIIWDNIKEPKYKIPENGSSGQYLKRTASGVEWSNIEKPKYNIPDGRSGQYLQMIGITPTWTNADDLRLPSNGFTGQYLQKNRKFCKMGNY